jgi:hypothetical protein
MRFLRAIGKSNGDATHVYSSWLALLHGRSHAYR